jgi:hypothetical protein
MYQCFWPVAGTPHTGGALFLPSSCKGAPSRWVAASMGQKQAADASSCSPSLVILEDLALTSPRPNMPLVPVRFHRLACSLSDASSGAWRWLTRQVGLRQRRTSQAASAVPPRRSHRRKTSVSNGSGAWHCRHDRRLCRTPGPRSRYSWCMASPSLFRGVIMYTLSPPCVSTTRPAHVLRPRPFAHHDE